MYFSPRGLITILLFLSIADYEIEKSITIDENVLLVVIIASMLVMIQGSITKKSKVKEDQNHVDQSLSEIVDDHIE